MRTSTYKQPIIDVLKKKHLLSISDIHQALDGADYSTVYRNIEQLVAAGDLRKVVLNKDTVMYELYDAHEKHDHFVCTDCGSVDAIKVCSHTSASLGNRIVTDTLIRGVCESCVQTS